MKHMWFLHLLFVVDFVAVCCFVKLWIFSWVAKCKTKWVHEMHATIHEEFSYKIQFSVTFNRVVKLLISMAVKYKIKKWMCERHQTFCLPLNK